MINFELNSNMHKTIEKVMAFIDIVVTNNVTDFCEAVVEFGYVSIIMYVWEIENAETIAATIDDYFFDVATVSYLKKI